MSIPPVPPVGTLASQCESRSVKLSASTDGYQPLSPSVWADAPDHLRGHGRTPSSSFKGSVDELLPSNLASSPPGLLRSSRISSGRTPRSSAHMQRSDDRQSSLPPRPSTALGAYAIAHEITLNAIRRDDEMLEQSLQGLPLAPLQPMDRRSLLPGALSPKGDPRSPKEIRAFSSPQSVHSKKVQVVPPPINVHESGQRSLPSDIIRTPYPFSPETVHRKDFGYQQQPAEPIPPVSTTSESILTLSIRRTRAHSQPCVTTITIPATNDFTAVRHSGIRQKEQHFKALDFDDAALFRQIRVAYNQLSGPARLLSARSLSRIVVSRPNAAALDPSSPSSGWLHAPRSPRELAYRGLNDSFSEEKILRNFRRPGTGKGRYAFVHWAHRLAAAPPTTPIRTPRPGEDADELRERDLVRRAEQVEGLEFVVSWSAIRIVAVLMVVLVASVAAALLWTLLGKNTVVLGDGKHAGFRGASDRVTSGVLMGICVLLLGLSSMAGWLGLSWLVM